MGRGVPVLRWLAIGGNILFAAWVVYNGIDEGFRGTAPQVASMIGLVALLGLNTALLIARRRK